MAYRGRLLWWQKDNNSLTVAPVGLVLGGSLIVHYVHFINEDHYKVRAG